MLGSLSLRRGMDESSSVEPVSQGEGRMGRWGRGCGEEFVFSSRSDGRLGVGGAFWTDYALDLAPSCCAENSLWGAGTV